MKHKWEWVQDKRRGYLQPSSLDKALARYAFLGEKVLNFFRYGDGWAFKVMA